MVKFRHEKMLTLYFPKKEPNHLNKIMFNPPPPPPPSENLDHPDKKLNSLGIIPLATSLNTPIGYSIQWKSYIKHRMGCQ